MADLKYSISDPSLYINREIGWLSFNRHVLDEAKDEHHPLLERVKFLAIFANNLDEFFMIRVSGLQRQLAKGVLKAPPDGMTPAQQLDAIQRTLHPDLREQSRCWHEDILPLLEQSGIHIHTYATLDERQKEQVHTLFIEEIFPVLTPLAFDSSHPFPFISNLSLNLAITVRDQNQKEFFARVKVPSNLFSRMVRIADDKGGGHGDDQSVHFVYLEEIIAAHVTMLFPGMDVVAVYPFRITRDADLEIEVDEASDLLTTVEEIMEQRARGKPIRIEVDSSMPAAICHMLENKLGVPSFMLYPVDHPLGMADLMQLLSIDRPDLKDAPFAPANPPDLAEGKDLFAAIRQHDIILYHPYDSFTPVVNFLRQAAHDPDVLAIKITLYRIGPNSPIVNALMEARENGKAVAALIELKARFDEENNIGWARALESQGVHVVYGVVGLKVHAKLCMIVRREKGGIRRYMHLGTGNYNASTSRIYTDFGMFTCDQQIGDDIAELFNFLTGYARIEHYRKLLVAPVTLRPSVIEKIEREIDRHLAHGDGYLMFKMNALVDPVCIAALYRASQAGVKIDLQVRGICCLRPGIPGTSENIRVTAIVGRFLEHARIYYFRNGGNEELFFGSADLMPRNLDRRVEVLFPVENPIIRAALTKTIIPVQLNDNEKLRVMQPDGTYSRVQCHPVRNLSMHRRGCLLTGGHGMKAPGEAMVSQCGACRLGASRLLPLLDNFEKEIEGVRLGKDSEYIHRMRVASRRLRAALPLFFTCFTGEQNRKWMNELKKVTKALGEARDTDVQIEFLRDYAKMLKKKVHIADTASRSGDPLAREIDIFLTGIIRRRTVLQEHVLKALSGLEKSGVMGEMRQAFAGQLSPGQRIPRSAVSSGIPVVAAERIEAKLTTFLSYEPWLADPDAITEHHAMRIAAKKLRYTLEVYSPVYRLGLKKHIRSVKKVQEILGDIHDCDVWIDTLTGMIVKQRSRSRAGPAPQRDVHTLSGIRLFLHDRENKRRLLHRRMLQYWGGVTRADAWGELRKSMVNGRKTAYRVLVQPDSGAVRAGVTAVAAETPEVAAHAAHVTKLALSLFDQTVSLHHLGKREHLLLEYAGLLHDIGLKYGQKGHSSRSREMIFGDERLLFDLADKAVVGIVVHAHRKGVRPESDPLFSLIPPGDRFTTSVLSGILRMADGLDYLHAGSVENVECSITDSAITCIASSARDISAEKTRAREKSDLFSEVFKRPVIIS